MSAIVHPLAVNTKVLSDKPPCACKGPGAPWETTKGIVRKVISNHNGVWYFLSSGSTVKSEWIKEVLE